MDISLNTLKNYVKIPVSAQQLAAQLTEAVCECEVEHVSYRHLNKIIAVKITAIQAHPQADNLKLVSFSAGQNEQQVVCGAPNAAIGLIVPYAPVGATLANGITLQAKEIRGIVSSGMLCSEAELGLSDNHEGLMVLPSAAVIGQSLSQLLPEDDILIIDNKSITHRSDLWSLEGLAREIAALLNIPYQNNFNQDWTEQQRQLFTKQNSFDIKVNESAALTYAGFNVSGVAAVPSPAWLADNLMAAGIRPINALVDISNFVMLELGIPTHFFDETAIKGSLKVYQLDKDKLFTTLDGKERKLTAGDTVIADEEKPLVIAGIMGGQNSMVNNATTNLFVEVAVWKGEAIRKTSLRLGLRTDASIRYEKALDVTRVERSLLRCAQLIKQIFPQANFNAISYGLKGNFEPYSVKVNLSRFNKLLGFNVAANEATAILERLAFKVDLNADNTLQVYPPSFRSAKHRLLEADIYEELGRMLGYHNIKPEPALWPLQIEDTPLTFTFERNLKDFFSSKNLYEVYTNPLIGSALLNEAQWPSEGEPLKLANSISPEHGLMRPALTPSILKITKYNQSNYESFALYEYGRAFAANETNFAEDHYKLALALFSRKDNRFIEAVNLLKTFYKTFNLNFTLVNLPYLNWNGLHPYENFTIQAGGQNLGFVSTVHPSLLNSYKIKGNLALAELNLTNYRQQAKPKVQFKPLSKFPHSTFDCTVIVSGHEANLVLAVLNQETVPYWQQSLIESVFNLADGNRAVTIRTTLASDNKTLNSDEIKKSEDLIVNLLDKAGYKLKI